MLARRPTAESLLRISQDEAVLLTSRTKSPCSPQIDGLGATEAEVLAYVGVEVVVAMVLREREEVMPIDVDSEARASVELCAGANDNCAEAME
jgi:hypothetical protein